MPKHTEQEQHTQKITYATMQGTDGKRIVFGVYRAIRYNTHLPLCQQYVDLANAERIAVVSFTPSPSTTPGWNAIYKSLAEMYQSSGWPAFSWSDTWCHDCARRIETVKCEHCEQDFCQRCYNLHAPCRMAPTEDQGDDASNIFTFDTNQEYHDAMRLYPHITPDF